MQVNTDLIEPPKVTPKKEKEPKPVVKKKKDSPKKIVKEESAKQLASPLP